MGVTYSHAVNEPSFVFSPTRIPHRPIRAVRNSTSSGTSAGRSHVHTCEDGFTIRAIPSCRFEPLVYAATTEDEANGAPSSVFFLSESVNTQYMFAGNVYSSTANC